MKIVVIGGTGLIGSKTVSILRQAGHDVLAASPKNGINSITGEGLKEAMAGADAVVDLANSPSFENKAVLEFFETSGRNLLAAEAAAGVKHHVALSIVGTDRTPDNGYFRAKAAQEKLIEASRIPYTIVRATQFLEFLGAIAEFERGWQFDPDLAGRIPADRSRRRRFPGCRCGACVAEERHRRYRGSRARTVQRDHRAIFESGRRCQTSRARSPGALLGRARRRPLAGAIRPSATWTHQPRGMAASLQGCRVIGNARISEAQHSDHPQHPGRPRWRPLLRSPALFCGECGRCGTGGTSGWC